MNRDLFFVNCEGTVLFYVKRDLDPPPPLNYPLNWFCFTDDEYNVAVKNSSKLHEPASERRPVDGRQIAVLADNYTLHSTKHILT